MPFSRPSAQEIIDRIEANIDTLLPGADARLRENVLSVLARVVAGQVHGLYGFQVFISRQIIPATAETEVLELWADVWGLTRIPPAKASGSADFTGTDGTDIPAETQMVDGNGIVFEVTSTATIAGGTASVSIEAAEGGLSGNKSSGVSLTLVSPITNINSAGAVDSSGLTGGTDEEDDDTLRARLLTRIQQPPHGGADFDYTAWAKEVAGVTRAWVYPLELGLGTVTVRFVKDDNDPIIPSAGEVTAVQTYIDEVRPVTADVTVVAPVAYDIDVTIASLTPDTADIRTAIEAELEDMLFREGEPGGTIYKSKIVEAISIATGESHHNVTSPASDVVLSTGEMPVLGTVTYS